MQHEHISSVIERAKQQRAEYIGGAIRKHPVVSAAVAGIPVLLTQLPWGANTPVAHAMRAVEALTSLVG